MSLEAVQVRLEDTTPVSATGDALLDDPILDFHYDTMIEAKAFVQGVEFCHPDNIIVHHIKRVTID